VPESVTVPYTGAADVARAAGELAQRIPEPLAPLARLAYNYRWSWLPGGAELFASVDAERFALALRNPVRLLQEAPYRRLVQAAANAELLARAAELEGQVAADLARPAQGGIDPARPVAFLCAEYGVHVSLPVYSGGLGALAGDLLKEASDAALPLVALGLMYRKGYFRQRIDGGGWQHEYWVDTDPERLPAALVTGDDGEPLTVTVPIYESDAVAQIWRVDVGRVPLFLLDTDIAQNGPLERWITARLYEADSETRLAQYMLLGAGGVRALRALGIEAGVLHLNEGHAAFAPIELAEEAVRECQPLTEAVRAARERTVFTTHTPVPAGHDTFPPELASQVLGAERVGLLREMGAFESGDLNMTVLGLRMSRFANGVSVRHGEVARAMFAGTPISSITNGVHAGTAPDQLADACVDAPTKTEQDAGRAQIEAQLRGDLFRWYFGDRRGWLELIYRLCRRDGGHLGFDPRRFHFRRYLRRRLRCKFCFGDFKNALGRRITA